MKRLVAALLDGERELRNALTAIGALVASESLVLASRSAASLDALRAKYGGRVLTCATHPGDDGALRRDLIELGLDGERAATFDRKLDGDKILFAIDAAGADRAVIQALVDVGADFGLFNGAGVTATLPLRREVLDVDTTLVADYDVDVRTEVVVETQHLEVRLERVEYVVERRDRSLADAPVVVTRIPLRHEEAVLSKRVVHTADVVVRTERHVETVSVTENLRHENFRIDGGSDAA